VLAAASPIHRRRTFACALAFAAACAPRPARAAEPDGAIAFFTGAVTQVAAFTAGGAILGTSGKDRQIDNAGWLTIHAGLTLAPLAAHGVAGEWARGAAFAAVPAAMLGSTGALFALEPGAVEHGTLPQQRVLWGLFGIGLASSLAGVIDAAFAGDRARALVLEPRLSAGEVGLAVRGAL